MEPCPAAWIVVLAFAGTVALGLLLLVAFEPEVQTIDAAELVDRRHDARRFLIADYVFIALYAVVSPIAQRRFGATFAPLLLAAAGVVDATENTLLLSSTGTEAEGRVDAAHALAAPKVILFVAGAILAVVVVIRAVRTLRAVR